MNRMLYRMYQTHGVVLAPARLAARTTAVLTDAAPPAALRNSLRGNPVVRRMGAAGSVIAGARLTHRRPEYLIGDIPGVGAVEQVVVDSTAFGSLLHFRRPGQDRPGEGDERADLPTLLLVAPLSGHFSTMLTPTVRTLLRDHDVYITDWHNARDISPAEGRFGLSEYIDHVIRFLRVIGPGAHVMAVCQPCVPALAAVSVLAEDGDPAQPLSLTLMSGPIDTRVSPTKINEAAHRRSIEWYRDRCVTVVPRPFAGAGRAVYPGFLQVSAFMSLNMRRHVRSQVAVFRHLSAGRTAEAAATQDFYREYFAVLDVPAEFYLETIDKIFQRHLLPEGRLMHHGRLVRPACIENTALLTVEAARDDMCAPGQTAAAHRLTTGLRPEQHASYVQDGVGHYGIFSGRRWENEVYPVVRDFVATQAAMVPAGV